MKKTYVWHGALLGITTAAFAVGCGGAPSDPSSSEHGSESAAITAIAPAIIDGCKLSMAFDITAAENIGFIAVQDLNKAVSNSSSALNNMQLTLFNVDNQSRLTEVNRQATQIDSRLSALLNQISHDSQFARQSNSATQLSDTHFSQYTDVDRKVAATTTTSTDQKEVLNQWTNTDHFAKHEAEQEAASKSAAASRSSAENVNKNAIAQDTDFRASNVAKEAVNVDSFIVNNTLFDVEGNKGWGYGLDPSAFFGQTFNNFAKQAFNESAFIAQNANQSSSVSARQASAAAAAQDTAAFSNDAARSRVATEDRVSDRTATHLDHAVSASQTTSTEQILRETTAIVTDQRAKAAAASDNVAENRNFSSDYVNQQQSSHASQSAFGFTDLSSLQSNHFILKVDIAAKNQEAAFQLFQGLNDSVFANVSFVESVPGCY